MSKIGKYCFLRLIRYIAYFFDSQTLCDSNCYLNYYVVIIRSGLRFNMIHIYACKFKVNMMKICNGCPVVYFIASNNNPCWTFTAL